MFAPETLITIAQVAVPTIVGAAGIGISYLGDKFFPEDKDSK